MIRLPFVWRSTYEAGLAYEREMTEAYRESRDWWLNTADEYLRELMAARAELARWKPERASDGRFRGRR